MRKSLLFLQTRLAMMLFGILVTSVAFGQATLKHSYTFDDGTANDGTGTLNGTVMGDGSVLSFADGKCIVTGATTNVQGYISFDGTALALSTYSAITLEFYVESENLGNEGDYTMLAYFGNNTGGNRCFWVQPTRSGNETRIEVNDGTTSVTAALGGTEIDDGKKHHLVAVLTPTDLKYYIDGGLAASAALASDYISTLDVVVANLFKGADGWGDPNYNCALDEFNIYEGEMPAADIAQKGSAYAFGEGAFNNALLDTLYSSKGQLSPDFSPEGEFFDLEVPFGTPNVTLSAIPAVASADVKIFASGNEITDGVVPVDSEFGAEVLVSVTALDGSTTKEYYVLIANGAPTTAATLDEIQLTPNGKLVPEFFPDSTKYVAIVPRGSATVNVTGVPASSNAQVTGGGDVTLVDGVGQAVITVVSEDGSNTLVYTIDIQATLTEVGKEYYIVNNYNNLGYVVGETGNATHDIATQLPLKDEPDQLWTLEESGVEGQYYIKNKNGNYWQLSAGRNVWNMEASAPLPVDRDSARFILDEYEPGLFIIESVARKAVSTTNFRIGPNDGNLNSVIYNDKWVSDTWTPYYTWKFLPANEVVPDYDNNLSALSITPGNIVFNVATTEYYVTLPGGTSSVNIQATPREPSSIVTGTGDVAITGTEGTLTVTCTASTGEAKSYMIHYVIDTDLTLMHSYTFADGTARDVVGGASGMVNGGEINEGVYTTSVLGEHISLPGPDIAINTYPSITIEAYTNDPAGLNGLTANTMLGFFGNTNTANNYGINYLYLTLGNGSNSRARISCLNTTSPWSAESGVTSLNLLDDFLPHHLVLILSNDSIKLYVDGNRAGAAATSADNKIANISSALAYICKGGYVADPTWLGEVWEYNIYKGQMSPEVIATRSVDFPAETIESDATLASIMLDGVEINGFASTTLEYDTVLAQGSTVIPEVSGLPKNTSAGVTVTQATSLTDSAKIEVTSQDGNFVNTYYVKFDVSNAVGDISESSIKVYPSVTDGSFRVVTEGKSSVISVYNLKGSLVAEKVSNKNEEFISLKDAGMYIVKVETQGITKTFKVIRTN